MADRPQIVAFDVIETVMQLEPLRAHFADAGLPSSALELWFATGLRDAFALAATGTYAQLRTVLEGALDQVAAENGQTVSEDERQRILDAMASLPPHPDADQAFTLVADAGIRIVALTNGSAESTTRLLEQAGLLGRVEQVISTDSVQMAKPRAEVYLEAVKNAGAAPQEVMLVAAHAWDIHGAKRAGLRAAYVDRNKPFPGFMRAPDIVGASLAKVAEQIVRG